MFSIIPVRFGAEPKGPSTSCAQLALSKHWMMVGTGGRPLPASLPHSSSTLLTHCLPENLISGLFSAFAKLRQHLLQEVFPEQLSLVSLQPTNSTFFPFSLQWCLGNYVVSPQPEPVSCSAPCCRVVCEQGPNGPEESRSGLVWPWASGFEGWMSGKGLGGLSDRVGEGL